MLWLRAGRITMKNTYNSHHKQLVNRQGFDTDAVKGNNHVGLIVNFDFTSMMQPNEKSFSSRAYTWFWSKLLLLSHK